MEKLSSLLSRIGLSEIEITVYTNLLHRGFVRVNQIAKETGLHRPNIYGALYRLQERGLVSYAVLNKVKNFKASAPESILDYLEDQKQEIQQLLPALLKTKKGPGDETQVEVFQGVSGLKLLTLNLVKNSKRLDWFGAGTRFEEVLSKQWFGNVVRKMEKNRIKERGILFEGEENVVLSKIGTYRMLKKKGLFPTSFIITENEVVLLLWEPPYFAIRIQNKKIIKSHLDYFNLIWKLARPFKQ